MGVQDSINYILFNNPVSDNIIKLASSSIQAVLKQKPSELKMQQNFVSHSQLLHFVRQGNAFVRIGGVMGAAAVILGAYGAHKLYPKDKFAETENPNLQIIFETANKYHFLNSIAMLCTPLCRYPKMSGSLLLTGVICFSGACYYHAITGKNTFGKLAPFGGMCLIFGWLVMVL